MSLQDKTVVQLKALARERGLKRYSKLKNADLIQLLNVPASLLDEDVPQIGLPDPVQPVQAPSKTVWTVVTVSYIPLEPKVPDTTVQCPQAKGNEPIQLV